MVARAHFLGLISHGVSGPVILGGWDHLLVDTLIVLVDKDELDLRWCLKFRVDERFRARRRDGLDGGGAMEEAALGTVSAMAL